MIYTLRQKCKHGNSNLAGITFIRNSFFVHAIGRISHLLPPTFLCSLPSQQVSWEWGVLVCHHFTFLFRFLCRLKKKYLLIDFTVVKEIPTIWILDVAGFTFPTVFLCILSISLEILWYTPLCLISYNTLSLILNGFWINSVFIFHTDMN